MIAIENAESTHTQCHHMPPENMLHLVFWCWLRMFNTLYSSMNQQLFEKNLSNQTSHYENLQTISATNRSHHMRTAKLTLFRRGEQR